MLMLSYALQESNTKFGLSPTCIYRLASFSAGIQLHTPSQYPLGASQSLRLSEEVSEGKEDEEREIAAQKHQVPQPWEWGRGEEGGGEGGGGIGYVIPS